MENYKSPNVTLDDIVFEGRNKSYGAYLLRKVYNDHVLRALLIAGLVFSLGMATPVIVKLLGPAEEEEVLNTKPVELKDIEPPPIDPKAPPPPPPPPAPPPPKVSTVRFVPPEPVPDEEVVEPDPPKQEEIKEAVIATETVEGDPNADVNIVIEEAAPSIVGEGEGEETVFQVVEQMPEFEGGMAALSKYLSKNLKYPAQARNANIQGTVFVGFVVGNDGKIRDVSVLKGIGYGCDEEAKRVVSAMPPWKPGKQSGRAVSVRYSLPIRFVMQ
jgi:protein TonB